MGAVPGDPGAGGVEVVGPLPGGVLEGGHVPAGPLPAQAAVVVDGARGVGGGVPGRGRRRSVDPPGHGALGVQGGVVEPAVLLGLGQAAPGAVVPVQAQSQVVDQDRDHDALPGPDRPGGGLDRLPVAGGTEGARVLAVDPDLREAGVPPLGRGPLGGGGLEGEGGVGAGRRVVGAVPHAAGVEAVVVGVQHDAGVGAGSLLVAVTVAGVAQDPGVVLGLPGGGGVGAGPGRVVVVRGGLGVVGGRDERQGLGGDLLGAGCGAVGRARAHLAQGRAVPGHRAHPGGGDDA